MSAQRELFGDVTLDQPLIRWRAESTRVEEPIVGGVRTRSPLAALLTLACELLHCDRYGLARATWRVRLWHHGRWQPGERTIRVLAPSRGLPLRAWIPGVGLYDVHGEPIRRAA